jgi:hypothetical protein
MPITSKQPNYPVIYEMFNHDDSVRLVPFRSASLNMGDIDQFNRGRFKLRILLDKGLFLKVCVFDQDVVYQAADNFVVTGGSVMVNGQVANLYVGG